MNFKFVILLTLCPNLTFSSKFPIHFIIKKTKKMNILRSIINWDCCYEQYQDDKEGLNARFWDGFWG